MGDQTLGSAVLILKTNGAQFEADIASAKKGAISVRDTFLEAKEGAMLAADAIKKVAAVAMECLDAFAEEELAAKRLGATVEIMIGNYDQITERLIDYAEELMRTSGFSHEMIENQMSMAITLGRTEDQVKGLALAATELANAGVMPLDAAFQALGLTYEGNIRSLGRMFPELKTLTDAQLENGEAVRIIEERVRGMNEALSDTTDRRMKDLKNAIDEMKEKIGESIASFTTDTSKLIGIIDKIGDIGAALVKSGHVVIAWFPLMIDSFIGFFNLLTGLTAAVAKTLWAPIEWAFHGIIDSIKDVFVGMLNWILEKAEGLIRDIGKGLGAVSAGLLGRGMAAADLGRVAFAPSERAPLGDTMKAIWADFGTQAKGTWTTIEKDLENILKPFQKAAEKQEDAAEKLDDSVGAVSKAGGAGGGAATYFPPGYEIGTDYSIEKYRLKVEKTVDAVFDAIAFPPGYEIGTDYAIEKYRLKAEEIADALFGPANFPPGYEIGTDFSIEKYRKPAEAEQYSPPGYDIGTDTSWIERAAEKIGKAIENSVSNIPRGVFGGSSAISETVEAAIQANLLNTERGEAAYPPTAYHERPDLEPSTGVESGPSWMTGLQSQFTQLAEASHNVTTRFFNFADPLGTAAGALGKMFLSLNSVKIILDPLTVIFNSMMNILGPAIDEILTPIIGILVVIGNALGQVLAPVLTWISPIIAALGEGFVWLYNNVIAPVGNLMWAVFTMVGNAIANFCTFLWNIVTNLFDPAKWKWGTLSTDLATLLAGGPLTPITTATLTTAGAGYIAGTTGGAGGGGAGGAEYTQAPDQYFNFYIMDNDIVGDGGFRELAIRLRTELQALGTVGI